MLSRTYIKLSFALLTVILAHSCIFFSQAKERMEELKRYQGMKLIVSRCVMYVSCSICIPFLLVVCVYVCEVCLCVCVWCCVRDCIFIASISCPCYTNVHICQLSSLHFTCSLLLPFLLCPATSSCSFLISPALLLFWSPDLLLSCFLPHLIQTLEIQLSTRRASLKNYAHSRISSRLTRSGKERYRER